MKNEKITVPSLLERKKSGKKISVLTAYDYTSARLLDAAGVDVLLVGDSLANVVQGKSTTLSVTVREMIYHAEMVARAASRALVVVDLPFPHCQLGPKQAAITAAKIMKNTLADAVKIEGGANRSETIRAVVETGVPVMGHCGLQPQEIKRLGKFALQRDSERLFEDIGALQEAGAFSVVLECIPHELAKQATARIGIPTIGIGAGPHCDGQVLVINDMLGYEEKRLKHVKHYAHLGQTITEAVRAYCSDVQNGVFPPEK